MQWSSSSNGDWNAQLTIQIFLGFETTTLLCLNPSFTFFFYQAFRRTFLRGKDCLQPSPRQAFIGGAVSNVLGMGFTLILRQETDSINNVWWWTTIFSCDASLPVVTRKNKAAIISTGYSNSQYVWCMGWCDQARRHLGVVSRTWNTVSQGLLEPGFGHDDQAAVCLLWILMSLYCWLLCFFSLEEWIVAFYLYRLSKLTKPLVYRYVYAIFYLDWWGFWAHFSDSPDTH